MKISEKTYYYGAIILIIVLYFSLFSQLFAATNQTISLSALIVGIISIYILAHSSYFVGHADSRKQLIKNYQKLSIYEASYLSKLNGKEITIIDEYENPVKKDEDRWIYVFICNYDGLTVQGIIKLRNRIGKFENEIFQFSDMGKIIAKKTFN